MKNEKIIIYGLFDIRYPNDIRYVGKTKQKITKRIHDHKRESAKLKTAKDKWMYPVLQNNFFSYKILETVNESNWNIKEKFWIDQYDNLTNTSKGGDRGKGFITTLTYNEMKQWVRKNASDVTNSMEWVKFVESHPNFNIPKYPYSSYKNRGWVSWSDFLVQYNGILAYNRQLFSYNECKKFIVRYNIPNSTIWRKKKPLLDSRVPRDPVKYFSKRDEWDSWQDFLSETYVNTKLFP